METTVTPAEVKAPTDLANDVVAFFEALRAEQTRFLAAMADARAVLEDGEGQLAQISAVHGRLTRQFFDAQRLIMQRRAEADAEVERISAETDEHAHTVLASALAHSAAASFAAPSAEDRVSPPDTATDRESLERTSRHAAAALSALAARTKHDADSIERVVNEAFELRESQDARFERQLQHVLDEWWEFEKQESKALVDDARARSAMRLHVTHLEACQIMGDVTPAPELPAPSTVTAPIPPALPPARSALPEQVQSVLDGAGATDLESVLADLAAALAAAPVTDLHDTDVIVRFGLDAPPSTTGRDAFEHFWTTDLVVPPAPPTRSDRFSLSSVAVRVVVPIFAITSLLAVLMAWMG
ncbi:MAG: hypothetical protein RJA49_239 [Actinomycetota bacterium]